jgi:hypothetical protein
MSKAADTRALCEKTMGYFSQSDITKNEYPNNFWARVIDSDYSLKEFWNQLKKKHKLIQVEGSKKVYAPGKDWEAALHEFKRASDHEKVWKALVDLCKEDPQYNKHKDLFYKVAQSNKKNEIIKKVIMKLVPSPDSFVADLIKYTIAAAGVAKIIGF